MFIASLLSIIYYVIDDPPVGNDKQDTATNSENEDNPVSTNGKENIIFDPMSIASL